MKKIILTTAFAAAAMACMATSLTPDEALKAALGSTSTHNAPLKNSYTLAYTGEGSRAYAFNRAGEGFMIVAGDTDFGSSVIGYSDSGRIDPLDMPDGLKWFIDAQRPNKEVARAIGKPAIANLVTTKWNQDSPYNNLCPEINGQHCMTGCVATAMAQILNHWKYPATGRGSISYDWNGSKLTHDFTQDTFDWNSMTDVYNSVSTQKQRTAVAQLMLACGMAAYMQYGLQASGAVDTNASIGLINYFNYDLSIYNAVRAFYSLTEWNTLIYESLAKNEPVLYTGKSIAGGHAFVICGYQEISDTDYFYVNWGWGGMADGYFMLNYLCPEQQGIGGGLGTFSSLQSAMLNIKPAVANSSITPNLITLGRFTASSSSVNRSNGRAMFKVVDGSKQYGGSKAVVNYSITKLKGYIGVKLTPVNGGTPVYVALDEEEVEMQPGGGFDGYSILASKFPTSGTYTVIPALKYNGKWYDFRQEYLLQSIVTVECSSTTLTFTNRSSEALTLSDIDMGNRTVVKGQNLEVTATLTAGIEGYSGVVMPRVMKNKTIDAEGDQTIVNLSANATASYSATVDIARLDLGTYTLVFTDDSDLNLATTPASLTFSIVEGEQEPGSLTFRKMTLKGHTVNATNPIEITENDLAIKLTVRAAGNYDGSVHLIISDEENRWKVETDNTHLILLDDESTTATFSIAPDLTADTMYLITAADENGEIEGAKGLFKFVVPAGITTINADSAEGATLYTLSGIRVTSPQPGVVYIMHRPLSRPVKVIIR